MPTSYMTDGEICMFYRQAADQYEQITILAELNLCDEDLIKSILHHYGLYDYANPPKPKPRDEICHGDKPMPHEKRKRKRTSCMPMGEVRRKTEHRRSNAEQERDYRPLYEKGYTDREIAAELGLVTTGGVVSWRAKNNLPPNPPRCHH